MLALIAAPGFACATSASVGSTPGDEGPVRTVSSTTTSATAQPDIPAKNFRMRSPCLIGGSVPSHGRRRLLRTGTNFCFRNPLCCPSAHKLRPLLMARERRYAANDEISNFCVLARHREHAHLGV